MRQDVTLSTQPSVKQSGQDQSLEPTADQQVGQDAFKAANIATAISKALVTEIGKSLFDMWFECSDSIECDNETVTIFAANDFRQARLQSQYGSNLRQIVNRVAGPHFSITYKTIEATPASQPAIGTSSNQSQSSGVNFADLIDSSGSAHPTQSENVNSNQSVVGATGSEKEFHDPQTCFDFHRPDHAQSLRAKKNPSPRQSDTRFVKSFWFGDENRLAKASVDQAFESPGQFSPLLFYGSTGCGKTHLLEAIVNDFRRRLRLKRCIYLSAEQFTSQFVSSLRGGSGLPMFRRKYRDLDLLAIDDVQFFSSKRATLNEFLHTVDNLARLGKQVIVSSDRPPIELDGLGADLAARLSGGLTCPLQYPGFDGRLQIIEKMCNARRFRLPVEVMELISNHMTRDVRRITGAVNRLYAVSKSLNEKVTMHMAQEVLADLLVFNGVGTSLVGIEQIICEFCGVKSSELRSKSRRKKVSSARMLAMFLSRRHTSSAFSEIGDHFGGRSHSTVIAAEKKVAQWINNGDSIQLPNADYPAQEVIQRIESIMRIG